MSPEFQTSRYEILENLGCGTTCRVDKAFDTIIGRTVAVKSFLQGFGKNSQGQFLQEARTIGRLSHPAIAQLYDVGHDPAGTPFLVMEFISGQSLEQLLMQSTIPFAKAAAWAGDIASALSYAHRAGIIHGDVKPGNIRVTESSAVKLVDFGVARFSSHVSRSDRVLGSPAYLSPEQIQGQPQDARSDLFSLGIVLYEMLTGLRPFGGNSLGEVCAQILTEDPVPPSHRNPELPAAFDRILARCLAKNPDHRYQTGNDLARALYLVARSGRQLGSKRRSLSWFQRPLRPRDFWAVASAVLLLASILVAAFSTHDRPRTNSAASAPAVSTQTSNDNLDLGPSTSVPVRSQNLDMQNHAASASGRDRMDTRRDPQTAFEQTR